MKSRPVLVGNSILATLQVLAGAAALGDIVGETLFTLFTIGVAAVTIGFNTYVQGTVVPFQDTAVYINSDGKSVAGPAAPLTTGTPAEAVQTPVNTTRRGGI